MNISPEDIKKTYYLVATSEGYYGNGTTLEEAAKNARATTRSGKLKRKDYHGKAITIMGWVNHMSDEVRYGQIKESAEQNHITYTGYSDEDFVPPMLGSYGNVIAWGSLGKLDLSSYPEVTIVGECR